MSQKTYTDITTEEMESLVMQPETVIVDVRDEWEFEEFNIGGLNIPLAEIRDKRHYLLPYDNVIVVCTNGIRSRVAAKDFCRHPELEAKNMYHLKGGILGVDE
ncbi:rhodanese-related sulfurtransferase [Larkinella arboricola]|uniref:Rhodanese-related sulfurtransferase n=1 Tax=Larkinella arboricola TaxID=643671 RepID=A0A327X2A4_LARAB|nr:rhodanese-like domain-containing protein [Larkinella arboricola]RAJ99798.1 rhodanese-related sulfurtransferase [Larkinella arboricola]